MNKKHFVTNKDLIEEIDKYNKIKIISPRLGEMFLLMCEKIQHQSFFRRYSFHDLEDMKTEALITIFKGLSNYDIEISSNPFSYYTQIIINAYKQFLKKKYKNDNFKLELIEEYYAQNNIHFDNEIKKDIIKNKKNKKNNFMENKNLI